MPNFFISVIILVALAIIAFFIWKKFAFQKRVDDNSNETKRFVRNKQVVKDLELNQQDLEILFHISDGCSNQEIANKTSMSVNTVNSKVRDLFSKLDVNRRSVAIKKARALKLIP